MPSEEQIVQAYELARERYAEFGVSVVLVILAKLQIIEAKQS